MIAPDTAREHRDRLEAEERTRTLRSEIAIARALRNESRAVGDIVTADQYLAIERPPIEPYLQTPDAATILLARGTGFAIAGPSGLGKSLLLWDLLGRLAADDPTDWLGLSTRSRLNVLALSFEGSDEDTADRIAQLVPGSARGRLHTWDRWRSERTLKANRLGDLAAIIADLEIDVLSIDTLAAFFSGEGGFDTSKGIPHDAHDKIEELRRLSGRDFGWLGAMHTRKAERTGAVADQLEEIAGTIHTKLDAAIVLRRDGDDGPRRRLIFAKTRRGPEPATKIAALPTEADAPPRLTLIGDAVPHGPRPGTDAATIAEWIKDQPAPVAVRAITDRFDISDGTLRDRRSDLEKHGITHDKLPGHGNSHGYGTPDHWLRLGNA